MIKKNYTQKNSGYTLMEALVAISLIVFSMVGPLSLASKSLSDAQYAKDQITAYYLAQEVVEWVRNVKDTNGANWISVKSQCGTNYCDIDALDSSIYQCNNSCPTENINCTRCAKLKIAQTLPKLYKTNASVQAQGLTSNYVDSRYSRGVKVTLKSPDEYEVSARVEWQNGLLWRNVTVSEFIFQKH